jgi:superfamily II DNA or RNA helicase
MVEVDFGPNERRHVPADLLEPFESAAEPLDDLAAQRLGTNSDLRRVLGLEKISGRLTNVFYSMESSNTDFYPHQFKPVLKFLESPEGRLLIADEVGLGKTIEATYIWKELQAREGARRLLVICPAMLREKWRDDLQQRFAIHADIVGAKDLHQKLQSHIQTGIPNEFAYVCGLEALRPPARFEDETNTSNRAKLARLIDGYEETSDGPIFDLAIIDEAHYLRNPDTASNRLGRLIRDASEHLLLLTATPIQIHNNNLFQLLRLTSPDDFFNQDAFQQMLEANEPVIRALRKVWQTPPDIPEARSAVDQALESTFFQGHPVLNKVRKELDSDEVTAPARRAEIGRRLENASLLGRYMTRTRKRDAFKERVERSPQSLQVEFTSLEKQIYQYVTEYLRRQGTELRGPQLFALIARQRQMASCMPAALRSWETNEFLDEVMWEALGFSDDQSIPGDLNKLGASVSWPFEQGEVDFERLEREDSKFDRLQKFLAHELEKNSREKFVVFAYFRGTLYYLQKRLEQKGIRTCLILGGMGDRKWEVIREFARADGPNVLLSSEVGSEGIDLQFCRFVVNYDLPWNPMRVEQRIGRLDRIGQHAERISIVNLFQRDTIEERILERLYERVHIFEESIGDLEDILGEMTEELAVEMFRPELSDSERERKAEDIAARIESQRQQQRKLEAEAINLVAFSDYILDSIENSREQGRWLRPEEILSLVSDFLERRFPGSQITTSKREKDGYDIRLSPEAQASLADFKASGNAGNTTRLDQTIEPVTCVFDARRAGELKAQTELIGPTHPLVRWMRAQHERTRPDLQRTAAVRVPASFVSVSPGVYAFVVEEWEFEGLRAERRLVYQAMGIGEHNLLDEQTSETLVNKAAFAGDDWANAGQIVNDYDAVMDAAVTCAERLKAMFQETVGNFFAENESRCSVQRESARRFSERRLTELRQRLERFKEENRTRMVPATEGLIRREEVMLRRKLDQVERHRQVETAQHTVGVGIIKVE